MIGLLLALVLAGPPAPTAWEVTAYTYTGDRTASGPWPAPGMAACPRRIPFGTRVRVPGWGVVTCRDRGPAIYGNRLDLFMGSRTAALRWGRRRVVVEIVG